MSSPKRQLTPAVSTLPLWVGIGALTALLNAPNVLLTKILTSSVDVVTVITARSLIAAIIILPFLLRVLPRVPKRSYGTIILTGLCITTGLLSTAVAIHLSQAVYVSVINLLMPVSLIILSLILTKEHLRPSAIFAFGLTGVGALIAIALPALIDSSLHAFYPLATLLILVDCVAYPLSIVLIRKLTAQGVPATAIIGSAPIITLLCCLALLLLTGASFNTAIITEPRLLLAVGYSALVVTLLLKFLTNTSYEKLGSAITASFLYLTTAVALVLPMLLINERPSLWLIAGGIIILIGVWLLGRNKTPPIRPASSTSTPR